jgi:hypothetical protein
MTDLETNFGNNSNSWNSTEEVTLDLSQGTLKIAERKAGVYHRSLEEILKRAIAEGLPKVI